MTNIVDTPLNDQSDNPVVYFPGSLMVAFRTSFEALMPDHQVVLRPLRHTDPTNVIGIFPGSWVPTPDSALIGQFEIPIATHIIKVQNMVKAFKEEDGRAAFSAYAKMIRAILYRDPDLRVRLGGLQERMMGTVERVKRYGVTRQDFMTNELAGTFVFLAITDVFIETETSTL